MIEVKVGIKGIQPGLLMDSLRIEDIINPPAKPKKYTEEVLQQMAEKALYHNGQGLFIPNRNVKKCLIQGAQMGRIKLAGRQNLYPFIEASVFIEPHEIPLNKTEPDNYIQIPMRRKDGNVIPKRLPICLDWALEFGLLIYDDEIIDKVKQALEIAGISVGLGNQRPEYGRFEVTQWEVVKEVK
ncbi:hypothetical protein ES708_32035 [subsurface metagenome]